MLQSEYVAYEMRQGADKRNDRNRELMVRGNAAKENRNLVSFQKSCIARLEKKTAEDMKQVIRYSHLEVLTQEVVDIFI